MDHDSAARLLDAFSDWVLEKLADVSTEDFPVDGTLLDAIEKSQTEALRTYRSSGSFEKGLDVGKATFQLAVGDLRPEGDRVFAIDLSTDSDGASERSAAG